MSSTSTTITSYLDKNVLPWMLWFVPRVLLHPGLIPHALSQIYQDSGGCYFHTAELRLLLHYLCLFFPGKKKKKFNMLFKLINIMNQRPFGKSLLWLEAHCGSAHFVKVNLAEESFYLWRICHLEPIDHGDIPYFPNTRTQVSFYLIVTSLSVIYLPWEFFPYF